MSSPLEQKVNEHSVLLARHDARLDGHDRDHEEHKTEFVKLWKMKVNKERYDLCERAVIAILGGLVVLAWQSLTKGVG